MFMSADVPRWQTTEFSLSGRTGRSQNWPTWVEGKVCQVVADPHSPLQGIMAVVGMKKRKEVAWCGERRHPTHRYSPLLLSISYFGDDSSTSHFNGRPIKSDPIKSRDVWNQLPPIRRWRPLPDLHLVQRVRLPSPNRVLHPVPQWPIERPKRLPKVGNFPFYASCHVPNMAIRLGRCWTLAQRKFRLFQHLNLEMIR